MLAEISMGLSSLKAASDILKGLNAANTQATINDAKISLQGHVLDAQQSLMNAQETQTALTKRVSDLEQQIVQLKNWEAEKQHYELKDVGNGCLAYTVKAGMETREPPHSLCASCYNKSQKSILQPEHQDFGRVDFLICHECGSELIIQGSRMAPRTAQDRRR